MLKRKKIHIIIALFGIAVIILIAIILIPATRNRVVNSIPSGIFNPTGQGTLIMTPRTVRSLESMDKHRILNVDIIGKSAEDRPIYCLKLSRGNARKNIFIMCRQHGFEPGSSIASLNLVDETLNGNGIYGYLKNLNVYWVLESNPDGAAGFVRTDSAGNDLNRQWNYPRTPEVRVLKKTIAAIRPNLVLDMHDLGKGGSFVEVYQDGIKNRYTGRAAVAISSVIKHNVDPAFRIAYSGKSNNQGLAHRALVNQYHIPAVLLESSIKTLYAHNSKCIRTHRTAIISAVKYLASR